MGIREDLIAAKALIDTPEKWTKNYFRTDGGCYCAVGAITQVTTIPGHFSDRADAACVALRDCLSEEERGSITGFNDLTTTTHDDIMALFDRAIAKAGASHV